MAVRVTYDRDVDAVYIYLTEKPYAYGRNLDEDRRVDYDVEGKPRGVELLSVKFGINLDDLPERDKIAAALEPYRFRIYASFQPSALLR